MGNQTCCKRVSRLFTCTFATFFFTAFLITAQASTLIYGPTQFNRVKGKPTTDVVQFDAAQTDGVYQLTLNNGNNNGSSRVSSGDVYLNNIHLIGSSDFSQQVAVITRVVDLNPENTLSVTLRGKPGGSVTIRIERLDNQIPIANAGTDQSIAAGNYVTLDGTASSDGDGDTLTFDWTLTETPAGSAAVLDDASLSSPSFFADQSGQYTALLVVNDGLDSSAADSVLIQAEQDNSAPVADAGTDQSVHVGELVTLDGSQSSDVDGDPLSFQWVFTDQPAQSMATLSYVSAVSPSFEVDQLGDYALALIVNDGQLDSNPDNVVISTENTVPIASAGPDQSGIVNTPIVLDGSASNDPDGDPLVYRWSLSAVPAGSLASIDLPESVIASFTPDLAGQYVTQLIVNDGWSDSDADALIVNVDALNTVPVADAGIDQSVFVGQTATLDGNASNDADGDILSYLWSLVSKPDASNTDINNATTAQSTLTADVAGQYVAQLIVNDGQADSTPDTITISTENSRPQANAGADQTVTVDSQVTLDGSASNDADNDSLNYNWSLISQPLTSSAVLADAMTATPELFVDAIGFFVAQLVVSDGDLSSDPDTITIRVESLTPLAISIIDPEDGAITNQDIIGLEGQLSHLATLDIDGVDVPVGSDLSFFHNLTLAEGANTSTLIATDALADQAIIGLTINLDTQIPGIADLAQITSTGPDIDGLITISGGPGSVEANAKIYVTNTRTGGTVTTTADANGAFSVSIEGVYDDIFDIIVEDVAGNQADAAALTHSNPDGDLPVDPASVAPPIDPTESASFLDNTAFLYSGSNPIQSGVASGIIELVRAAIIRGQVLDTNGNALSGVTVTVHQHEEYGFTLTRADGEFDMAVNGGGLLTVDYQKNGYLPVQRQVNVKWNDFAIIDNVVMMPLDVNVTLVDLEDVTEDFQVAQGSPMTDADGTRQATVLFPRGVAATMTLSDGSMQTLNVLNVRATEYTVGLNGPSAMPGELPASSAYTYAVELSVDEAISANAVRVDFDQDLPVYVDNFLNFPVGEVVPSGWYDREKALWVPSNNGKIIGILAITEGKVDIDLDGNGVAATPTELLAHSINEKERTQLATLYGAGQSFWRIPVSHFTPWDFNWPGEAPDDAEPPPEPPPEDQPPDEDEDCEQGCIIQPQSQSLGEKLSIAGFDGQLTYQSERMAGYSAYRVLDIPISGDTLPASLQSIELTIAIAGQKIRKEFSTSPNQNYRFVWDGKDRYGRPIATANATVTLEYHYPIVYSSARNDVSSSFDLARGEGSLVLGVRENGASAIFKYEDSRKLTGALMPPNLISAGLGNWGLDIHHAYDPLAQRLYKGNGSVRDGSDLDKIITTTVRNFQARAITVDSGGRIYFGGYDSVKRLNPDGTVDTVAGGGSSLGDGGLAVQAELENVSGLALAPDGSLYIAEDDGLRVRKVSSEGIITTVAGTGAFGYSGDGGLAVEAELHYVFGIAVSPDGVLYIATTDLDHDIFTLGNAHVRRVGLDGVISTVVDIELGGLGYGEDVLASQAQVILPSGLAVGPDGSLYIADSDAYRIRRIYPNGIISTAAGIGYPVEFKDNILATEASLFAPSKLTVDTDGGIYFTDRHRLRYIDPNGIITTLAGSTFGGGGILEDGWPATQAQLDGPSGVALDKKGNVYTTTLDGIKRIGSALSNTDANEHFVASVNGEKLFHFDEEGRHLRTLDTTTGAELYLFRYDANGYLLEIEDVDGDITRTERVPGEVTIVAADGQRTVLNIDLNNHLKSVIDAAGENWRMSYTDEGLMTDFIDRNGNNFKYTFDSNGYLVEDLNPIGGGWKLSRNETENGYTISMETGEGRIKHYQVENLNGGVRRHTNTDMDGSVTIKEFDDAKTVVTYDDGTVTTLIEGNDPRFNLLSPIVKLGRITTPGGLFYEKSVERMAVLADDGDLLSHTNLTETVTVNGKPSITVYDTDTRTESKFSPEGRTETTVFDEKHRILSFQEGSLAPAFFSYDSRGRLQNITFGTGPESRVFQLGYDGNGYFNKLTNSLAQVTDFTNDILGRITRRTLPDTRNIDFTFDANGNMTELTPPERDPHVFDYTDIDQEKSYTPPTLVEVADTATTSEYNKDKQLTRITRPDGKEFNLGYHPDTGKLSTLSIPRGNYTYAYDQISGDIAGITAPDGGVLTYSYDGVLPIGTNWSGQVNGNVTLGWNDDFLINRISVNGDSVNYAYDDDNFLIAAGDLSLMRDSQNGLVSDTVLGNVSTERSYNEFAEMMNETARYNTGDLYRSDYVYDRLGRITQKQETIEGLLTTYKYSYDIVGRLKDVTINDVTVENYSYDSNSNRSEGTYDEQDRLLTWGSDSFTYTANGELESKNESGVITNYHYDVIGNLINVTLPGDLDIEYLIDGENRRIGKKINSTLVQGFLYKDKLNPVAELDGMGNVVARFIYAEKSNVPAYMEKNGNTYRIISDHLGSPRLVVNIADGSVIQRIDYDVWGKVKSDTNPGFQPFGFAGGIYDQHTQFVRFGMRDYDSVTARWMSKDPIGFRGGDSNLYRYTLNDPINFIDPDGLRFLGLPRPGNGTPGFNRDLHESFENLNDPAPFWKPIPPDPQWYCGCPSVTIGTFNNTNEGLNGNNNLQCERGENRAPKKQQRMCSCNR